MCYTARVDESFILFPGGLASFPKKGIKNGALRLRACVSGAFLVRFWCVSRVFYVRFPCVSRALLFFVKRVQRPDYSVKLFLRFFRRIVEQVGLHISFLARGGNAYKRPFFVRRKRQ